MIFNKKPSNKLFNERLKTVSELFLQNFSSFLKNKEKIQELMNFPKRIRTDIKMFRNECQNQIWIFPGELIFEFARITYDFPGCVRKGVSLEPKRQGKLSVTF